MKEILNNTHILKEIFKKHGIQVAIIDADDTLFDTTNHFRSYMKNYASSLSSLSDRGFDDVYGLMFDVLDALRPRYNVHSTIMLESARITALSCGLDFYNPSIQERCEELMSLYKKSPEIFPGVKKTLEVMHDSGISLILFAHSSREWVEMKVRDNDLENFFAFVFAVSPLEKKNRDSLKEVIEKLDVQSNQVLMFGDSWVSDIRPAMENGIPKTNIFRICADWRSSVLRSSIFSFAIFSICSFVRVPTNSLGVAPDPFFIFNSFFIISETGAFLVSKSKVLSS